jgi:hypothetical protein
LSLPTIAAGIQKRAHALVQQKLSAGANGKAAQTQPTPVQLPEAPASVNVHLTVNGRQVQLTLRDSDESRLLARLDAVLQRYPLPPAEASSPRMEQGPGVVQQTWRADEADHERWALLVVAQDRGGLVQRTLEPSGSRSAPLRPLTLKRNA